MLRADAQALLSVGSVQLLPLGHADRGSARRGDRPSAGGGAVHGAAAPGPASVRDELPSGQPNRRPPGSRGPRRKSGPRRKKSVLRNPAWQPFRGGPALDRIYGFDHLTRVTLPWTTPEMGGGRARWAHLQVADVGGEAPKEWKSRPVVVKARWRCGRLRQEQADVAARPDCCHSSRARAHASRPVAQCSGRSAGGH